MTDLPNDNWGRPVSVDSENGTSTYSVWSDTVGGNLIFTVAFPDDWPLANVYNTINSNTSVIG